MTPPTRAFRASPSAISTFRECQRKWAFRSIKGLQVPQAASAALGTEMHEQLESYLGGSPLDYTKPASYVAAAGLHLLPAPGTPGLELEQHFSFTRPSGIEFHGFMDITGPDSTVFPGLEVPCPAPFVSDHKSTSNFKYAKTREDLKKDPQGVIYAKAVFNRYPLDNFADLIWTYYATKGAKKAKRVHLRVVRSDVDREFEGLDETAAQMQALYIADTDPLSMPAAAVSVCKGYGGCPFHYHKGGPCRPATHSILNPEGKKMTDATAAMLSELTARLPATQITNALTNAPAAFGDLLGGLLKTNTNTTATNTAPPVAAITFTPTTEAAPAINPPGEAAPVASVMKQPPAPDTANATAGSKRTRRTKLQIEADERAKATEILAQKTADPVEAAGYRAAAATFAETSGWTLYIDCFPVGSSYRLADELFATAEDRIKQDAGVDDYRLIDFKGAGVFRTCVMDAVSNNAQDIVLDSRTPEGALCLAGLSTRANRVVRSMR